MLGSTTCSSQPAFLHYSIFACNFISRPLSIDTHRLKEGGFSSTPSIKHTHFSYLALNLSTIVLAAVMISTAPGESEWQQSETL